MKRNPLDGGIPCHDVVFRSGALAVLHYAPRMHFVLKDSTRGSRPNFKRGPTALCRETAPSVPLQSAFIRNRGRNFLIEVAHFVLTLLSSSFFIFFFSLLLPGRATATHRGQILFKDALAQQLCEQGGEWQHPEPVCTRCMFPPGQLYVHTPTRTSRLSPPIIVHHVHQNVRVWMNHRLSGAPWLAPSPLSNEAATARDSWMSYIASLIPAYAKRSFTLLSSSSLSPSRSGGDLHFLDDASYSNFFFFPGLRRRFEQLPPDAAFVLGVCNCLFTGRTPPPLPCPPTLPHLSSLTLNPKSGQVGPTAGQTASDKAVFF